MLSFLIGIIRILLHRPEKLTLIAQLKPGLFFVDIKAAPCALKCIFASRVQHNRNYI
jgi:hypothetical protein